MADSQKIWRLVIIGPSGGGKGTQAKLLAEKFGLVHISVGQLIREEIKKSTALGKRIEKIVNSGHWLPSKLVFQKILKPVLDKIPDQGFVLDGFPREIKQAVLLDKYLQKRSLSLDFVFWLKVRPAVIYERRKKIQKEKGRFYDEERGDESEEAIRARIQEYQRTISPIVKFYRKKGILVEIDGERSIEEIHQEILERLRERING